MLHSFERSGRVRAYGHLSDLFAITSEVRQDCPISSFLFNFVIDNIMNAALNSVSEGIELASGKIYKT